MGDLLLSLDTATSAAGIALSRDGRLLGAMSIDSGKVHGDRILLLIRQLLGDCGVALEDVGACAVVTGPGSFTGLRVGVATAKGLALALGCPLIPLSSLEVLAAACPFARPPVCALIDARKGQVYTATYSTASGLPILLRDEEVVAPEALAATIVTPTLLVGSGAVAYRALLSELLGERALAPPFALHLAQIAAAAPLAHERWRQGGQLSAARLLPCYIRPSEAELAQSGGK